MSSVNHLSRSVALTASSALVWIALLAANLAAQRLLPLVLPLVATMQGLWLYRLYAVAHEASHRKLFPEQPLANELAGSLAMLWVWAPITVFRQIHEFHHGANRRADGIATLDTFVVSGRRAKWRYFLIWYAMVFAGGFFLHTLASILLFLVLPRKAGLRLSPAFARWTWRKRLLSWLETGVSLAVHGLVVEAIGASGWMMLLGAPIIVFAWIWSAMLYIYHYKTTVGRKVQHNVRSLPDTPLFSWLLLNFNHHSVHHDDPEIPWYDLPRHVNPQPADVRRRNETVSTLRAAILQQLAGPRLVARVTERVGTHVDDAS